MDPAIEEALGVSSRSFINALLKEWDGVAVAPSDATRTEAVATARLPLAGVGRDLLIDLEQVSRVGHHSPLLPLLEQRGGAAPEPIDFSSFAALVAQEACGLRRASPVKSATFLRRLFDSVGTIEDVLSRWPDGNAFYSQRDPSFIEAEQGLRFGHSLHPTPRSRDEFAREDARRFAPEHGQGFALRWWSVAAGAVAHGSARDRSVPQMTADLVASDPALAGAAELAVTEGRVLVPMHPWQASRLMLHPAIEAQFRAGSIVDFGSAGSPWFATSSLRSVHAAHAAWMLKFSLSLRLTNSRRIVETKECARGKEVDLILASPVGAALRARFPHFTIMGEPAHLSLRGPDGEILPETTVVFRDNPFRGEEQPPAAVLATLCERDADGRGSPLAALVRRIARSEGRAVEGVAQDWFGRFLDLAAAPCLYAQAQYGLLFGAHQQNLVIGLKAGRPVSAYFRDCQGTGYVRSFLPMLGEQVPGVGGAAAHVFDAPEAARLIGYYLGVNSIFGVVAALAAGGCAGEVALLAQLRAFLERLVSEPLTDRTCIDYLLNSPTLSSKGNFMICFSDINENTDVTDPFAGYVEQPNPIAGA
jgi:N2-citryl-N6-acetyl-N6-hydroxylysine synthase